MEEYKKENIVDTYWTIDILDSCWKISGDVYDEISRKHCPQDLIGACKKVVEMIEHDKELKDEPKWEYRVIKHEEDEDNDWQTAYKVYKYRGQWKFKVDYDY
jgi:hypothetical protein